MQARTRRRVILGAASGASLVGIAVLAVRAVRAGPEWLSAAAASPLAVRCIVIMALGVLGLGLTGLALARLEPGRRVRRARGLHADQGGTAAVEMVLLFPMAVMIFLIITQAALLFNANMVVHYSGFAAARVATVVIPMNLPGEARNLVYNPDLASNPPSEKLELIRRAAVLALVPVSGEVEAAGGDGAGGASAVEGQTRAAYDRLSGARAEEDPDWIARIGSIYGDDAQPWWFRRVRDRYRYADLYTEVELAKPHHWRNDGNPDNDCPYRRHRRGEWTVWGWNYVPYCPYWEEHWDYWYWEDLATKVDFKFPLEVPFARALLAQSDLDLEIGGERAYVQTIRVLGRLSNEGGIELLYTN